MATYEWIKSPDGESTYGFYLDRDGVKYPLAIIQFSPTLGANDLESMLRGATDLLDLCNTSVIELANIAKMVDPKQTDEYMEHVYTVIARAKGRQP